MANYSEFFGEPWPSGICDEGTQVPTPVGDLCLLCDEPIADGDRGSFMGRGVRDLVAIMAPVHRECSFREVMGGIGHLEDHERWCLIEHDPDGGRTRRQSSLEVWDWVQLHGMP